MTILAADPLLRRVTPGEVLATPRRPVQREALAVAAAILEDIESAPTPAARDEAALRHARRLGDLPPGSPHLHDRASLRAALDRIEPASRDALERAANRIRAFARAQRDCIADLATPIEGGAAGHTLSPVDAAGCYAPGGRAPLPSSVLMTAIPARVAGVRRVVVASPRPTDATLAAAALADADAVLAIGGAQAVAALALGLLGAPACDVIVGPGNRYVTAAKFLVSDRVGIDMLAGPSELLILADGAADPRLIAADLLAQAEHDDDAVPMLIVADPAMPARVDAELRSALHDLPTRGTARAALRNGWCVVVPDVAAGAALADRVAPEHLEIMTRDADAVARLVRNAGCVFIGAASAEVLGDYGAGPNHVLPTGGSARSRAGLSVFTFLRARTWLRMDATDPGDTPDRGSTLRRDAATLARVESLEAHARAAEARGGRAVG